MVNTLIYILVFLSQSQSAPDSGDSTLFFFSSRPSLPVNGRPRLRSSLWPSRSHPSAQFGLGHSSPVISNLPSWLENSLPPLPWNDLVRQCAFLVGASSSVYGDGHGSIHVASTPAFTFDGDADEPDQVPCPRAFPWVCTATNSLNYLSFCLPPSASPHRLRHANLLRSQESENCQGSLCALAED